MARRKHIKRKSLITLLVFGLCLFVIYFTWGKGSLYMLKPESKPPQTKVQKQSQETSASDTQTKDEVQEQKRDDAQEAQDEERDIPRLCMLNDGECPIAFTHKEVAQHAQERIQAHIQAIPNEITALESVVFRVSGAEFASLRGVIYGLNMDMGAIEVVFHKVDDNLYEGRAILASCAQEVMQYRMQLQIDERFGTAAIDFDAKRKDTDAQ